MEHKRTFTNSNAQTSFLSVIRIGMEKFCMGFHQTPTYHLTLALLHPICSCRGKFGQDKSVWSHAQSVRRLTIQLHFPQCHVCVRSGFSQDGVQLEEDRPYVKKPLNAFMIFRKEQRPIIMKETNIRDSASVNTIVGKKVSVWASFWIYIPNCPKYNYVYKMTFNQKRCGNSAFL